MLRSDLTCRDCTHEYDDMCEYWECCLCEDVVKRYGENVCCAFDQRNDVMYILMRLRKDVKLLSKRVEILEEKTYDGCRCVERKD